LIGKHLAVDGDSWDAHPGHEAPVPPHPKDAILGSGDFGGHFFYSELIFMFKKPI